MARSFYERPAAVVARDLLGKTLCHLLPDGTLRRGRIVETEAYVGAHDKASHARVGRTARNASMWGPPGRAYVYFVYGMHHCLNVVTAGEGDPQAVLVRAAEPLDGWSARLDGPARLAKAFAITRADDGTDLLGPRLWVEAAPPPRRIQSTPRIGVAYAGSWAARRLRFVDADSGCVSGPGTRGGAGTVPQRRHRRAFKHGGRAARDG